MSLAKTRFFFLKNTSLLSTCKPYLSQISLNLCASKRSKSLPTASTSKKPIDQFLFSQKSLLADHRGNRGTRSFHTLSSRFQSQTAALNQGFQVAKAQSAKTGSKWPINSHKSVGYVCIGTSILVFAIVVVGGLTRLTESGLSITEWKPITGSIPPLTEEDWKLEFEKYKQSPEFQELNSHITLEEFKFIFSMEWGHRLLGRVIGLSFVLPTFYFIARRKCSKDVALKLLAICSMIGFQGFIGWWMVYSGLDKQQLAERNSKPTVSPYRLTTHLGTAFVIYCYMIYTGLQVLKNYKIMKQPEAYVQIFKQIASPKLKTFKRLSTVLLGLVFITAMSGGLVAGLDAGLIYNTFPHMGDDIIPSSTELMSPVFARKPDQSDLFWRNMLENPTTVQLNHRILAVTTFFSVFAVHMYSHRLRSIIPKNAYRTLNACMGLVTIQAALGISTLIYLVPIELATAHQAGALGLLTGILVLFQQLRRPNVANIALLKRSLQQLSKTSAKDASKPLN
ncbi:BA75_04895T0 [Komagataella pastoris]|uniref:BA75_04895T0 n=1 Tax=Komagataella pastoris TaxID=4922 RepID=A0A1B2JJ58_PICPA|nr:BA75_04895T0 [Komagataella pastoris]